MIGTVDNPVIGDIWEQGGWVVVPVNTQGIHGRGLAKQACAMGVITRRKNTCFAESNFAGKVITIAVKGNAPETAKVPGAAWSERVVGGNLTLLKREVEDLRVWWLSQDRAGDTLWVPFLGLGFGEGRKEDILPILRSLEVPGVRFIRLDAETVSRYLGSFVPGVRQDSAVAEICSLTT